MKNFPIPEKTRKQNYDLYPFQKATLTKMLNSPSHKIINADEMGLGKSPVSYVYPNVLGLSRVLVVCTASARLNQAREADRWFTLNRKGQYATAILSSKDLLYINKKGMFRKDYLPTPFIVSYDMLVSSKPLRDYVANRKWDYCIIDEFHEAKSFTAQRTQIVMFLLANIPYCMLTSGTPLTNSAADLFPSLNAITQQPHLKSLFTKDERNFCNDFDSFTSKFTYVCHTPYGIQYRGIRNRDLLKKILKNPKSQHYFRNLKKDVLPDLPDVTYNRVDLNLNVKTSLDPKFLARFLRSFESNSDSMKTLADSKEMGTLRRELGEAIITCKDAHEFTKQFLDYGKPIIIFAWHKSVISFLTHHFRHYNPVVHDGSKTPREKQHAVDTFQNGHTNLFIGNIKSAGVSITLTRAADCIFYEIDWLPHIIAQAIGRPHRIGQLSKVTAHFFTTKNEFHQHFMQTMIRKQVQIDKVI